MLVNFCDGKNLQVLSSFIATFGIFGFGLAHLWPSPAIPTLLLPTNISGAAIQITTSEGSWIASIEMITIPFSAITTIYLANYFGTRALLQIAPIPLALSWILVIYGTEVWYLYIARVLVGISESFFYNTAPIYISEIADPKIRGILVYFIPIMFNTGGVVVYYFGYVLSVEFFATLSLIPLLVHFVFFMLVVPPTPYYFVARNQYEKAREALKLLRGRDYKEEEFEAMKKVVGKETSEKGSFKVLLSNSLNRKCVAIITIVALTQQLSGSASITNYVHYIIVESEFDLSVELSATVVSVVTLIACIMSTIWIDSLGRRPLLLISCLGSSIAMLFEGVFFNLKESGYDMSPYTWMPGLFLVFYVLFINFGIINIANILVGELFPTNVRNYGCGITLTIYGLFGFLTTKIFQVITDVYGMSVIFYVFCILDLVGLVFIYFYVPETRQKSFAEIQTMLKLGMKPKINRAV